MSIPTALSITVLKSAGFLPSSLRQDIFIHSNMMFHYPSHKQDNSVYWAGQFVNKDNYGLYTPAGPEIRSLEQLQQAVAGNKMSASISGDTLSGII